MYALFFKLPEVVRFLMVGGINHAFGTGMIWLLQYVLGAFLWPQVVYLLGYVLCSWPCFYTQHKLVFQTDGALFFKFIKYFVTTGAIGFFGVAAVYVFYDLLGFSVYLAQFLALTVNAIASFILLKFFVFKA